MIDNFIRCSKQAGTTAILVMTFFFFFTIDGSANENQGIELPSDAVTAMYNAKALWDAGDKAGARGLLLDFIEAEPDVVTEDIYYALGLYWYNDGNIDEALQIYEEAYSTYPESEKLLRAYAGMLFKDEKYAEAAPMLEEIYAVSEKKEPRQLLSAGQAYYLAENLDDAKRVLLEMKDMDAYLPLWLSTLYQVCIARGDDEEAQKYWEEYGSIARYVMIEKIKSDGSPFLTEMIEGSLCPPENENNDGTAHNLNEVDSPPKTASMYLPMYPIRASVEGIQGRVVLGFVVDRDGYVQLPEVVSAEPEGYFEESALDAVMEYRFLPAIKNGKCVDCIVRLPVVYELEPDMLEFKLD
jgi:TonB family protein